MSTFELGVANLSVRVPRGDERSHQLNLFLRHRTLVDKDGDL